MMAKALMAMTRKVTIFDLSDDSPEYMRGLASVVVAMSNGYRLVTAEPHKTKKEANAGHLK
jgi:hypothetical protein